MTTADIYAKATSIGTGLFAARDFDADEVICEIRGRVIADPDYSSDTCMDLGEERTLEPEEPYRFLNHNCSPNAELFTWDDEPDGQQLYLHALRPVAAGEELTIDYAWPAEDSIPCLCQSPACRGWIVSADEAEQLTTTQRAAG